MQALKAIIRDTIKQMESTEGRLILYDVHCFGVRSLGLGDLGSRFIGLGV